MKVTVVSGIWPPDVGGPAAHAPALARFLVGRGHEVEVVTTADTAPAAEPIPDRLGPTPAPPRSEARGRSCHASHDRPAAPTSSTQPA